MLADHAIRDTDLLEGGGDGHGVEYGIDGNVRQPFLLVERDAQLLKRSEQLRVNLIQ
jgi:hypothetical protein